MSTGSPSAPGTRSTRAYSGVPQVRSALAVRFAELHEPFLLVAEQMMTETGAELG